MGRAWTREEDEYLEENWGRVSVPGIAAKLNRTRTAIKERASKKGLGRFLESGEYITLNQLAAGRAPFAGVRLGAGAKALARGYVRAVYGRGIRKGGA